ncbi:transporter substrate-binding domain-containing protein [Xinfangfangia pollutisoli]|uniref:transporter substrate-binding domain-containing protein n=1 Tax=Xinfangfangia pollutisoli TaxID=2865960 RepID=UPI001CD2CC28|nr:transporter substrate-binding domain-containing protein [Xinfangfangia pollutisoli]
MIDTGDTWKLGVLFSETGPTAIIESLQQRGALLAIKEINAAGGVAGRALEPVLCDPGSDPQRYGLLAEKMISEDCVRVLIGCYMSSARKEVLPVVERRNVLFFYPTLYEGFEYSPNVIYGGACPNQNSVPLASYLLENYGNRFYFIGSDYIYPRESNRVMRNILRQGGGEVVGEVYVPFEAGPEEFARILRDVAEKAPDAIFCTTVGETTVQLYRAYHAAGHDGRRVPIASLTTNEAEIATVGAQVGVGHITAAPWFNTLDTPASRRFCANYQREFGPDIQVTSCAEAAYFQTHMFAAALDKVGSLDPDQLRECLLGASWDAPQGQVKIDPDNNHTYLHSRIARVDERGDFIVQREVIRPVKPDPYLVTPDLNDRRLRLRKAMPKARTS